MQALLPALVVFGVFALIFAIGFWFLFARAVKRDRDSS